MSNFLGEYICKKFLTFLGRQRVIKAFNINGIKSKCFVYSHWPDKPSSRAVDMCFRASEYRGMYRIYERICYFGKDFCYKEKEESVQHLTTYDYPVFHYFSLQLLDICHFQNLDSLKDVALIFRLFVSIKLKLKKT